MSTKAMATATSRKDTTMKPIYFVTMTRSCPLVPVRIRDIDNDGRITLIITKTCEGHDSSWIKGQTIVTDNRGAIVVKSGHQHGRFSHIDEYGRWIYVKQASI